MNIEKEVKENQSLLFLIPKSNYSAKLIEIVKSLNKNFKKICYVSLNRSYKNLKKYLTKNKINFNKFSVIGLNKYTKEQDEIENYRDIGSANNLGGINVAFSDFVYGGCKIFLFDSISDMIIHVKENELLQFIHTMIIKAKIANTQVIFLASNENVDSDMLKELGMLFDKIITDTSK